MVAVENGEQAVEAVRQRRFDFIITDLLMPQLSGWEILRYVRRIKPQPRVVIITAQGSEETREVAIQRGAWAYVEKPYIIERIKGILKKSAHGSE